MDPKEKSRFDSTEPAYISLKGRPVYALEYLLKDARSSWDITSFRPDPRDTLKAGTAYKGAVSFSHENLYDGTAILVPREIWVEKRLFKNIR